MSYRPFKVAETDWPHAAVATPATVQAPDPQSVARIASVARAEPNFSSAEPPTVANVASVARHDLKSQLEPKLGIKVAEDDQSDVVWPFTLATVATVATLPDEEAPSVARIATVADAELDFSTPGSPTVANVASVASRELEPRSLEEGTNSKASDCAEWPSAFATLAIPATLSGQRDVTVATVAGQDTSISCEEVRAAFEVAADRFAFLRGVSRAQAEASALAMVRGALLNDARLVREQPNPTRCLVCRGPNVSWNPLVPVLTPIKDRHLWLHLEDCHAGAPEAPSPESRRAAGACAWAQ